MKNLSALLIASFIAAGAVFAEDGPISISGPDSYDQPQFTPVDPHENMRNYRPPATDYTPGSQARYLGRLADGGDLYENKPGHQSVVYQNARGEIYTVSGLSELKVITYTHGRQDFYENGYLAESLTSTRSDINQLDQVYFANGAPSWQQLADRKSYAYQVILHYQRHGVSGAAMDRALVDYDRANKIWNICERNFHARQ